MTRQRRVPVPEAPAERHPVDREAMVREEAYFLYERNGRVPGRELDDWLAAEAAVDRALALLIPGDAPEAVAPERRRAPAAARAATPRTRRRPARVADDAHAA